MNLTEKIGEGNQADVYLYRGHAYKWFHSEKKSTAAFWEAASTSAAAEVGLTVPKVYEVFTHRGRPVIKMAYARGMDLNSQMIRNPDDVQTYMKVIVSLQIQIHNKKAILPVRLKDRLTGYIEEMEQLSREQKNRLFTRLKSLPDGDDLCHGDFHGGNILCEDGRYMIIDWADASTGDACADACRTYMLYSFYSAALAGCYLAMYCEYRGVREEAVLQWLPVIAAARLSENYGWESERIGGWLREADRQAW